MTLEMRYFNMTRKTMKYITRGDIIKHVYKLIKELGSQELVAKYFNVSQSYISDIISGKRGPGEQIPKTLGLKKITVYVEDKSDE
jgi:hypothetical protein